MRRFYVIAAMVAVVAAVALPTPAGAAQDRGTRIGLFAAPATFAANTPFYVEHGFVCVLGDRECMGSEISIHSSFDLYVNGELQASRPDIAVTDGTIGKLFLTSFRDGLPAGIYVFHGEWWSDGVLVMQRTATITFS